VKQGWSNNGRNKGRDAGGERQKGSVFTSREIASNFSAVVASVIMRHYTLLKKKKKKKE